MRRLLIRRHLSGRTATAVGETLQLQLLALHQPLHGLKALGQSIALGILLADVPLQVRELHL